MEGSFSALWFGCVCIVVDGVEVFAEQFYGFFDESVVCVLEGLFVLIESDLFLGDDVACIDAFIDFMDCDAVRCSIVVCPEVWVCATIER